MALNFPTGPNVGDQYDGEGLRWEFGSKLGWFIVGDTPVIPPYTPNPVSNASTGYLTSVSGQASDGPQFELSYWIKPKSLGGSKTHYNLNAGTNAGRVRTVTANTLTHRWEDTGALSFWDGETTNPLIIDTWVHIYIQLNAATLVNETRFDGVLETMDVQPSANNGVIPFGDPMYFLTNAAFNQTASCEVFDFFMKGGTFTPRGYDAFHDAGAPINIDGYTDANVLMTGPAADWNTPVNLGTMTLVHNAASFVAGSYP
jgi:hypothetical protein